MNPTEYELFIQQFCQELLSCSGIQVYHLCEYTGRISQRKIKVDVSFETHVLGAKVLVLVECKYYKSRVDVGDVEEFYSKLDDIGAHKGIIVTTIGFQDGAVKVAKGRGIALALLKEETNSSELHYITKGYDPDKHKMQEVSLFQGNLRPWGRFSGEDYKAGFRFDSVETMLKLLSFSLFDQIKPF